MQNEHPWASFLCSSLVCSSLSLLVACGGDSAPAGSPAVGRDDAALVTDRDGRPSQQPSGSAPDAEVVSAPAPLSSDASAVDTATVTARADALPANDAASKGDVSALQDAGLRSVLNPTPAKPVPANFALNCGYSVCGGDALGAWELKGYCDGDGKGLVKAQGSLVFNPDQTYTFLLQTVLPAMDKPAPPQTGIWQTEGSSLAITPNKMPIYPPYWPHGGAFVIGRNWGPERPITYCTSGDILKVNAAAHPSKSFWVFARKN